MTVAVGFAADDGYGLLTDSCFTFQAEDGEHIALPDARTFHSIPSVRASCVASGWFLRDVDTLCADIEASTVEQAAGQLFRELERDDKAIEATWPLYREKNADGKSPELLIVGGPDVEQGAAAHHPARSRLRLGVLNRRVQAWIPAQDRAVVVIGAWTEAFVALNWLQRPPAPTLDGWLERAIYWGRTYTGLILEGRSFAEVVADGRHPVAALPLHAIIYRFDGTVREYIIDETTCCLIEPEVISR